MLIVSALIGAVFLRAGISLANRTLGPIKVEFPQQPQSLPDQFGVADPVVSIDEPIVDNSNPYASPASYTAPPRDVVTYAIPEPAFGKATGIVLIQSLVAGVINFVAAVLLERHVDGSIIFVAILFVNFLVASIVYTLMLPTSYGKAVLVCMFQALVILLAVTLTRCGSWCGSHSLALRVCLAIS